MNSTYSTEGPQCPHCGRQFTADDPFYYDERQCTKMECDDCNTEFRVEVYHHTSWTCEVIEA